MWQATLIRLQRNTSQRATECMSRCVGFVDFFFCCRCCCCCCCCRRLHKAGSPLTWSPFHSLVSVSVSVSVCACFVCRHPRWARWRPFLSFSRQATSQSLASTLDLCTRRILCAVRQCSSMIRGASTRHTHTHNSNRNKNNSNNIKNDNNNDYNNDDCATLFIRSSLPSPPLHLLLCVLCEDMLSFWRSMWML